MDFSNIIDQYGPLLSRVAASYEANSHLQQELLQEISLAVWQSLKGFKGDSALKTYILRVAHNKAVNHVTYQAKQPFNEDIDEHELPSHQALEQQLIQQDAVNALLVAVRSLPLQARQVMTMSMEGLSYQEIATVCGVSVVNVGVIINRAKKTLIKEHIV